MKRLEELETRLAADAAHWEESVEALKGMERLWYAGFLRQAVAALRNARTSLEAVADRRGSYGCPSPLAFFTRCAPASG